MKDTSNKIVIVGTGYVRIVDSRTNKGVEYRGNLPGGLACSRYAEQIIQARSEERGE